MLSFKFVYYLVIAQCNLLEAARILAHFPYFSYSHHEVFKPFIHELANRGHELTILTPRPIYSSNTTKNIKQINLYNETIETWTRLHTQHIEKTKSFSDFIKQNVYTVFNIVEKQLNSGEVKKLLSEYPSDYFDLLILESCTPPSLLLAHKFKAPVIQKSSFGVIAQNSDIFGIPMHPVYFPNWSRHKMCDLTLFDTMEAMINHYDTIKKSCYDIEDLLERIFKSIFGQTVPPFNTLYDNIDMLLLNVDSIWDGNRPIPPNVIMTGGRQHFKPPNPLPQDLDHYLSSSKEGVIYMSLGSSVNTSVIASSHVNVFLNVFAKIPYEVILKWNHESKPNASQNVKIVKWVPQADLLRHPKIKLFITQGGLHSTEEAISAGVPILGVPILSDQNYNTAKYECFGIGSRIHLDTINEEMLYNVIMHTINDKSYKKNIQKLSKYIDDRLQRPLERAIWWTEYVIQNKGAKIFRSSAYNISWREYLVLDVFAVAVAILITIINVVYLILRTLLKIIRNYVNVRKSDYFPLR